MQRRADQMVGRGGADRHWRGDVSGMPDPQVRFSDRCIADRCGCMASDKK